LPKCSAKRPVSWRKLWWIRNIGIVARAGRS